MAFLDNPQVKRLQKKATTILGTATNQLVENITTRINSPFTRYLGNYGGTDIFRHGADLTSEENELFFSHFRRLTADYPSVTRNSLREIHLFNTPAFSTHNFVHPTAAGLRNVLPGEGVAIYNYIDPAPNIAKNSIGLNVYKMRNQIGRASPITTTMVNEQGRFRPDSLAIGLEHEFGHHVEYNAASLGSLADVSNRWDEETKAAGLIGEDFKKDMLSKQEVMNNPIKLAQIKLANYANYTVRPILAKHFGDLSQTNTVAMINSQYAAKDARELFAETFSRGRLGEGVGHAQAAAWEREIRASMTGRSKMLRQVESSIEGLMRMRR